MIAPTVSQIFTAAFADYGNRIDPVMQAIGQARESNTESIVNKLH
jgi:hypothetical protein